MHKRLLKFLTLTLISGLLTIPFQQGFALELSPVCTLSPIIQTPLQTEPDIIPITLKKLIWGPSKLKLAIIENLAGGPNGQQLSWTDNSSDEDGFILERCLDGAAYTEVATLPANTTTAMITPEPETTWAYRVRATSAAGVSEPSNSISAEGMPAAPADLTVRPGAGSGNSINLHWEQPGNATKSISWILKRTEGSTASERFFTSKTSNYTDTDIQPDVQYAYSVQAISYGGRTAFSSPAALEILAAPKGISTMLTPGSIGISKLTVFWKDASSNEDGFTLALVGPDNRPVLSTLPANTTHADLFINDTQEYRLTVQAFSNNGNRSAFSEIYTWTPPSEKTVPPAPQNLTARYGWSYAADGFTPESAIDLQFTESFMQITQYIVERREGSGSYEILSGAKLTHSTLHSFHDTALKEGAKYTYRIKAVNSYGESPYSAEALAITGDTATLDAPPFTPSPGAIGSKKTVSFSLGSSNIMVDGIAQAIDADKDTQPIVSASGRTLIPIRSMIEKLGGSVKWTASDGQILIHLKDKTVSLYIGKTQAIVNGTPVTTDEPAQIVNGRTLLPVRFVSENLGMKVTWDPVSQMITIIE